MEAAVLAGVGLAGSDPGEYGRDHTVAARAIEAECLGCGCAGPLEQQPAQQRPRA